MLYGALKSQFASMKKLKLRNERRLDNFRDGSGNLEKIMFPFVITKNAMNINFQDPQKVHFICPSDKKTIFGDIESITKIIMRE